MLEKIDEFGPQNNRNPDEPRYMAGKCCNGNCPRLQKKSMRKSRNAADQRTMDNTVNSHLNNTVTISYTHEPVPNNFEHDKKPFSPKTHNDSRGADILSFVERYKGVDNDRVKFLTQEENMQHYEHGNYKMFGFSKNKLGQKSKFLTQRNTQFNVFNTSMIGPKSSIPFDNRS